MKRFAFLLSAVLLFWGNSLQAQIPAPPASPTSVVHQDIGLGKVELVYSRPGMKGRVIFAENGLVPFGKLWRTGANQATKLTFSEDMTFAGVPVAAGTYAMLTVPYQDEWTINLYAHDSNNFTDYLDRTPDVSAQVGTEKLNDRIETFTIAFQNLTMDGADLQIVWDETVVGIPIRAEVDKKVMAAIDRAMGGPTAGELFTAASYYHDTNKDLEQALEWVRMANEKAPRYWQLRRQSLIEADLGMVKDAITTAKKSLEMAKEAGNDDYVRMNEASIKEWTAQQGDE